MVISTRDIEKDNINSGCRLTSDILSEKNSSDDIFLSIFMELSYKLAITGVTFQWYSIKFYTRLLICLLENLCNLASA